MSVTTPKPFVFVLMPFDSEFDDIYKVGIKPACEEAGAYCERVDEQIYEGSILNRIYNQIDKADIIVADMSNRNPNVFYETGYAHALGKNVILLTQNSSDIPFDLKHYNHIIYDSKIHYLKTQLSRRVQWFIENPKVPFSRALFPLKFYIDGIELKRDDYVDIDLFWSYVPTQIMQTIDTTEPCVEFKLQIDIHNPTDIVSKGDYDIGIITPLPFTINVSGHRSIIFSEDQYLHIATISNKILPKSWESLIFKLILYNHELILPFEQTWILRVFTEFGYKDYNLHVFLKNQLLTEYLGIVYSDE